MKPYSLHRKPNGHLHESCGELILNFRILNSAPLICWEWDDHADYDVHYCVTLVTTASQWITDGVKPGFASATGINLSKNYISDLTHIGTVF